MKYKILEQIYNSVTGPINLVKDEEGKEYVLKEYQLSNSKGYRSGLLNELLVLKNIEHPNILKLIDVYYDKNSVNMITEKLDGELTELILEKPNRSLIRDYLHQILSGLLTLHQHGMIHNDLKMKNILYKRIEGSNKSNDKTIIKIIDFDLVYLIHFPYNRNKEIRSTHHFTPPEYKDYQDVGKISVNSDMWSLGILFYYLLNPEHYLMLYGNPNYDYIFDSSEVEWDVVKTIVGSDGYDLLHSMLNMKPDERISSLEAINHPFFSKLKSKSKSKELKDLEGGGRRWEIPNVITKEEFLNPKNQTQFLPIISEKAGKFRVKIIDGQENIPDKVINKLYKIYLEEDLNIMTLNYTFCLLWMVSATLKLTSAQWMDAAMACLYLSTKYNEYESWSFENLHIHKAYDVIKWELKIVNDVFKFKLPIPLMITKDARLYCEYLNYIYFNDVELQPALFRHYFLVQLIASLTYTNKNLINKKQSELVPTILSLFFKIKAPDPILRKQIVKMIKDSELPWLHPQLLGYMILK